MARWYRMPAEGARLAPFSAKLAVGAGLILWFTALQFGRFSDFARGADLKLIVVALSFVALWRYSWWINHVLRAYIYRTMRFPGLRRRADELSAWRPSRLCVLITSYRTDGSISWQVYKSLIQECVAYGVPTTLVAAISDPADETLIARCASEYDPDEKLDIVLIYQDGCGKRIAMAEGLRALSRRMPEDDAILILIDGDSRVKPGTFGRLAPFLFADPALGALTIDNRAYSDGSHWIKEWYELRLAQRHLLMQSMALSERVLVLTGRFSMFRARLALERSFIQQVESDGMRHWRLGRIDYLSGDDKSTWFWLLARGWKMLYVPDVAVDNLESMPARNFPVSSFRLMHRWFGNMLRINGRAIALGPRRMGLFTWWCLIDQRLSIWTTLVGPVTVFWLAVGGWPRAILIYLSWITITRSVAAVVIGWQRRRFSPYYIPLLYYQQIAGALVKIYLGFRLNRQGWTRQGITTHGHGRARKYNPLSVAGLLQTTAMVAFFYAVGLTVGVVAPPGLDAVRAARQTILDEHPEADVWTALNSIQAAPGRMPNHEEP